MTKPTRRTFCAEFKHEGAQLVLNQNDSVVEATKAMNVGKSTMDERARQLKEEWQGKLPKVSPMTLTQIKTRELEKQIARIEEEKEIQKKLPHS